MRAQNAVTRPLVALAAFLAIAALSGSALADSSRKRRAVVGASVGVASGILLGATQASKRTYSTPLELHYAAGEVLRQHRGSSQALAAMREHSARLAEVRNIPKRELDLRLAWLRSTSPGKDFETWLARFHEGSAQWEARQEIDRRKVAVGIGEALVGEDLRLAAQQGAVSRRDRGIL